MTTPPSAVPTASFAGVSRSGLVFGLSTGQLVIVLLALAQPMWRLVVIGELRGALVSVVWWTIPLAIVGAGSWGGISILERLTTTGLFTVRRITGQTHTVVKVNRRYVKGRLAIPGALGERLYNLDLVVGPHYGGDDLDLDDASTLDGDVDAAADGYGAGAAFVWDATEKTATAVLRFSTEAWDLADDHVKAARAEALGTLCKTITNAQGVVRVVTMARTYPGGVDQVPPPGLDERTSAGRFAAREHGELLSSPLIADAPRRDILMTVTVSATKAATDIRAAGGGVRGLSKVLANRVAMIADGLPACGVAPENSAWLGQGQIRAAIRLAFDPQEAGWLATQQWRLKDDDLLVQWIKEKETFLSTDSAFHRGWWVERMPALPVQAGFLTWAISSGRIWHTFTQSWEPVDLRESEKRLNNAETSRSTVAQVNNFLGRRNSTAHAAEGKELAKRRADLELGFGDVNYRAWLTVHAKTRRELSDSDMWVRSIAAGMKLKVLRGDQWACFNTAVLPLGIKARA